MGVRSFFDNPVDCIRQPKRDEISKDSSRQITLEGSRRASGRFCNARPGWSPGHLAAGWLARTGTRFGWDELKNPGGASSQANWFGLSEAKCDQFFSSTLWGEDRNLSERLEFRGVSLRTDSFVKGLILAQNERWRRGLGMQVERAW